MELLIGIVIGVILVLCMRGKPIRIEITNKRDVPQYTELPDMADTLAKSDKEDETYENMGEVLAEINDIMTGGNVRGKN